MNYPRRPGGDELHSRGASHGSLSWSAFDIDIDLLRRIDSELPYLTVDRDDIEYIMELANHKLVEAKLPVKDVVGQYVGPAVVQRMRPRGTAALNIDGDTMI